jgi:ribonuclease HI
MELQAAINGLDIISNGYDITPLKKIMIITDSHFVCYNRKNAYYGNRDRTKRQTKFNDPVIHKPLRRKFAKLIYEIKSKHFKPFEMDRVK